MSAMRSLTFLASPVWARSLAGGPAPTPLRCKVTCTMSIVVQLDTSEYVVRKAYPASAWTGVVGWTLRRGRAVGCKCTHKKLFVCSLLTAEASVPLNVFDIGWKIFPHPVKTEDSTIGMLVHHRPG